MGCYQVVSWQMWEAFPRCHQVQELGVSSRWVPWTRHVGGVLPGRGHVPTLQQAGQNNPDKGTDKGKQPLEIWATSHSRVDEHGTSQFCFGGSPGKTMKRWLACQPMSNYWSVSSLNSAASNSNRLPSIPVGGTGNQACKLLWWFSAISDYPEMAYPRKDGFAHQNWLFGQGLSGSTICRHSHLPIREYTHQSFKTMIEHPASLAISSHHWVIITSCVISHHQPSLTNHH